MTAPQFLLLPGWQDSDAGHWQSHWERSLGMHRLQQDDWWWPRRGDWMARLDEHLLGLGDSRAVLVAHSLGCQLVAAWAAHSRHTARVQAALLVAIPDIARADMPPQLQAWAPVPMRPLPFTSTAVLSSDDPYCSQDVGRRIAQAWGCQPVDAGPHGHLNSASALGDWPEGQALLQALVGRSGGGAI